MDRPVLVILEDPVTFGNENPRQRTEIGLGSGTVTKLFELPAQGDRVFGVLVWFERSNRLRCPLCRLRHFLVLHQRFPTDADRFLSFPDPLFEAFDASEAGLDLTPERHGTIRIAFQGGIPFVQELVYPLPFRLLDLGLEPKTRHFRQGPRKIIGSGRRLDDEKKLPYPFPGRLPLRLEFQLAGGFILQPLERRRHRGVRGIEAEGSFQKTDRAFPIAAPQGFLETLLQFAEEYGFEGKCDGKTQGGLFHFGEVRESEVEFPRIQVLSELVFQSPEPVAFSPGVKEDHQSDRENRDAPEDQERYLPETPLLGDFLILQGHPECGFTGSPRGPAGALRFIGALCDRIDERFQRRDDFRDLGAGLGILVEHPDKQGNEGCEFGLGYCHLLRKRSIDMLHRKR